jgi:hypothetical protein
MSPHTCQLPERPEGARMYRCPGCQTRYVWSQRMIGRQMREGWQPMRTDFETRRLRNDAEFKRFGRWAIAWGVVASVVTVALIVWIVLRVT